MHSGLPHPCTSIVAELHMQYMDAHRRMLPFCSGTEARTCSSQNAGNSPVMEKCAELDPGVHTPTAVAPTPASGR
jgi:hypothetical protein